MKIENEITGEIRDVKGNNVGIRLYAGDDVMDFFEVDIEEKEIVTCLNRLSRIILKVENKLEDYIELINKLGLEIPIKWRKHWELTSKEDTLWYHFIDSIGESIGNNFSNNAFENRLIENFNMFPTRELAEKAVNLSKLDRLILLWQYKNDCLFTPDWLDGMQYKYYIIYNSQDKNVYYDYSLKAQSNNIHFETSEQAQAFIDMYDEEIKNIMGISQC